MNQPKRGLIFKCKMTLSKNRMHALIVIVFFIKMIFEGNRFLRGNLMNVVIFYEMFQILLYNCIAELVLFLKQKKIKYCKHVYMLIELSFSWSKYSAYIEFWSLKTLAF